MSIVMAGAIAGSLAFGSKVGPIGGDILFGAASYIDAKKEGKSGTAALVESLGTAALTGMIGFGPMMAIQGSIVAAQLAPEIIKSATKTAGISNQAYLGSFGGGFHMTETAATMREVGQRAIQENGYNLRSVLGSEARKYVR